MNTLEELGRDKLKELLKECSEGEVHMFNRMYKSVDEIPLSKMNWAIQQCEASIQSRREQFKKYREDP